MQVPEDIQALYCQKNPLVSSESIEAALVNMAAEISQDLSKTNPIVLSVMVGALVFCGQLVTRLSFPLQLDYVHATRYRGKTQGDAIQWLHEPLLDIQHRSVLILDDVLDGGLTLQAIVDYCNKRGAAQVATAVLIDKPESRLAGGLPKADYTGLELPNEYIFGYGMDYHEYCRNLASIYGVKI